MKTRLLISSFSGDETGISIFELDSETGEWNRLSYKPVPEPFYIATYKSQSHVYSIYNFSVDEAHGSHMLKTFSIDSASNELTEVDAQISKGEGGCYLSVDANEKFILQANYVSGNFELFSLVDGVPQSRAFFEQHEGSSVNAERQMEAHTHSIISDPSGNFVFVADLGMDKVMIYRLNHEEGTFAANSQPFVESTPGAGPRHMVFSQDGRHFYVVNELLNTVSVYDFDAQQGELTEKQTIPTIPDDYTGRTHTTDLRLRPDGKFLYATNRGHDSIAIYSVESNSGELTLVDIQESFGNGPQNLEFAAHGSLLLVANMAGENLQAFHMDPQSGKLEKLGDAFPVSGPSCIIEYLG
ncbi:MAG: lactonase family protein [Lentisphaeria bacterium]|nr:lactonase family protein [Lentisphaeria bacterium]NQZ70623.1 lactonase family protein [Lentisphaeria bacterium]